MTKAKIRNLCSAFYGPAVYEATLVQLEEVTTTEMWRHACAAQGIQVKKPKKDTILQEGQRYVIYSVYCERCNTLIYYIEE